MDLTVQNFRRFPGTTIKYVSLENKRKITFILLQIIVLIIVLTRDMLYGCAFLAGRYVSHALLQIYVVSLIYTSTAQNKPLFPSKIIGIFLISPRKHTWKNNNLHEMTKPLFKEK